MNASPTPTKKRSVKKLLTACLSAVVAVALTTVAAAWFAGLWSSPVSFPVATGGNPKLPQDMAVLWLYQSLIEDDEVPDEIPENGYPHYGDKDQAEEWVEVPLSTPNNEGFTLPDVFKPGNKGMIYLLESMHFGRIDNLISLNEDNKIYFRFKLTPDHGDDRYTISFDYAERNAEGNPLNSIHLEKLDGTEVVLGAAGSPIQYDKNRPEMMHFLQFTYFFSPTKYDPSTTDFNTLPFKGKVDEHNQEIPYTIGDTIAWTEFTDVQTGAGDYYLYVCMTPKLETYGLHENILEYFAHSYMFFDVTFSVEVH